MVAVVAPRTRDGRLSDEVGATSVVDAEEIMYPLRLHLRGRDGCSEVMMVWSGVVEREREAWGAKHGNFASSIRGARMSWTKGQNSES